jgi:hypothetical protein
MNGTTPWSVTGAVWVELPHRERALSLMSELHRQHSYLIQLNSDRWLVHARCDADEMLALLVSRINEWRRGQTLDEIIVHHSGGEVRLTEDHPARLN